MGGLHLNQMRSCFIGSGHKNATCAVLIALGKTCLGFFCDIFDIKPSDWIVQTGRK